MIHGINSEDVKGTGKGNRITKEDILNYMNGTNKSAAIKESPKKV